MIRNTCPEYKKRSMIAYRMLKNDCLSEYCTIVYKGAIYFYPMKSLLIIFILFQNCFFIQAQFYTVSKQPVTCKVQKQQDLPETGETSNNDSSTKVGKSKRNVRMNGFGSISVYLIRWIRW